MHTNCQCYCSLFTLATVTAAYGVLHLDNGTSLHSGTLMFQLNNGTWGTMCSSGIDQYNANVCNMVSCRLNTPNSFECINITM